MHRLIENVFFCRLSGKGEDFKWELGTSLIFFAVAFRFIEKLFLVFHIQSWMPPSDFTVLPAYSTNVETWSVSLSCLIFLSGVSFSIIAARLKKYRILLIPLLMFLNVFTNTGGSSTGKGLVLLQPALMLILILELCEMRSNVKRLRSFMVLSLLSSMYFFNGLSKTGIDWSNGTAISNYLTSNIYSLGLENPPKSYFLILLTHIVHYGEIFGCLIIFPVASWRNGLFKKFYGLIAIIMHLFLLFFSPLAALSITAMSLWIMIWPGDKRVPEELFSRCQKLVLMFWIFFLILPNLKLFSPIELPPQVSIPLISTSLYPKWRLFSPSPIQGRIRAELLLPSGENLRASKHGELSFLQDAYYSQVLWGFLEQKYCHKNQGIMVLKLERKYGGRITKSLSCGESSND